KYGIRNHEGGGRSSARETIGRVAAGAVAAKVLQSTAAIEVRAYIERIHDLGMDDSSTGEAPAFPFPTLGAVEASPVRCPDPALAERMIERIKEARSAGDSVGGLILCRVRGLPAGLGEPVFDRLEADLGKAMLSLPATKGFEVGSGFAGTLMKGSAHNDPFENVDGQVRTRSNRSGGVQGGISNGEELYFRIGFKPTATILQSQPTVDKSGAETELMGRGRHDPCVVPRAVPIVEAMTWLVLLDHWMAQQARQTHQA
ncbi:MAG: chorismate synthase, partial [Verrucomicrobiota bacterium]